MTRAASSPLPPEDLLAHASFVRGLARALVSGDADVEDLVQETWLAALGSGDKRIRRPRSWLASIVRRRAARHHRDCASMEKRHTEGARAVETPTPDDLAARREIIQKISAAMAALPVTYHDALVLRYYEELPPREVARRLEIPVETARTRIRRGLARLREILDESHRGERAAWAVPLSGLLSSGTVAVGLGTVVLAGLAVAALLVLAFALLPGPRSEGPRSSAEQAKQAPDEVASPTLTGRGAREGDAVDLSVPPPPSDAPTGAPAESDRAPLPEDEIPERFEVLVRVVDEQGRPVEGLGVCEQVRGQGGPFDVTERPLGRTDAAGRVLAMVTPGVVGLGIETNDSWHQEDRPMGLPEPGTEAVITVIPKLVLRGRVIDDAGSPVEGVRVLVHFRSRSEPGVMRATFVMLDPTDADGRFTASVPAYAEEIELRARSRGATGRVTLDPRERHDVVVRISLPYRIAGRLLDEDGSPLIRPEHLKPRIRATPEGGGEGLNGGLVEGSNRFCIDVPEAGRYRVSVEFPGNDPSAPATPDALLVEAPADGLEVVCPKGHELAGRVVAEDVAGFQVSWLRRRPAARGGDVGRFTRVDAEGRFVLGGLLDGDTLLFVYRPGDGRYGLLERVRLPAENLTIDLQRGRQIRGRVRGYLGHHGFEPSLAFTWRGPAIHAEVDDDGTFSVTGLPPGTYGVRWQRAGKEGDLDLEVEAGNEEVDVVLPEEVLRMGLTPEGGAPTSSD